MSVCHRLPSRLTSLVVLLLILVSEGTTVTLVSDSAQPQCTINSLCECRATEFNCFSVPLHKLPEWPYLSIQNMDVTGAMLRELEEGALDGLRLNSLALAGNKLSEIAPNSFKSMSTTLLTLDLGYNELSHIPYSALRNLNLLFWINLQNNNIATFSGDWALLGDSLTSMCLSNNELTSMASTSLTELKNLARLDLDGNKLRLIPYLVLPKTIVELKLSSNLIESLFCPELTSMVNVKSLNLRDNHIKNIPACSFKASKKMDKIDLADNLLNELHSFMFNGTLHVRYLDLEMNSFTEIPSSAFQGMKVAKLVISHNKIENVDSGAFVGLEHSLEQLELDDNKLQFLPNNISECVNLKHFSVASNFLSQLFKLPPNLETLILSRNYFLEIPRLEVSPKSLRHVDLSYNILTKIQREDFTNWSEGLSTLILKGNKITRLEESLFSDLLNLKKLSLSFNELHYLNINVFMNLSSSLRSLEMSQSMYCEEFPIDAFSPLENLLWLSLDNNNYRSIQPEALNTFFQLQYLNLESNQLLHIPVTLFNYNVLSKLRDIRLSYNLVEYIESETFTSLPELKTLDLSVNKIQNISSRSFKSMPKLMYISLASNMITNIDFGAFRELPKLVVLELQYNELKEFSLNSLYNVSGGDYCLNLNLSHNKISIMRSDNHKMIEVLDLSYNLLLKSPTSFFMYLAKKLKRLILSYNKVEILEVNAFANLIHLQILKIDHNSIHSLHRRAFNGLKIIQILDLSFNEIEQLHIEQFANLRNLRYLKLNNNRIRSCPREAFMNTVLEHLDLSGNQLKIFPNVALSHVGFTLRYLDISDNFIEYLDSTIFQDTPFLLELYLGSNRITTLSDNTFNSVSKLRVLDLSLNNLRTNFKELFHFLPNLRILSLANCGLKLSPYIPLNNITVLNLTGNHLEDITEEAIKDLLNLRELYIGSNRFNAVPSNVWHYMKYLRVLDLSNNPIRDILNDSFRDLDALQDLNICHLNHLEHFSSDGLKSLRSLSSLQIQSWSNVNKNRFSIGKVLTHVPSLQKLTVLVTDELLSKQLIGVFNPKLKVMEIWGENLKAVSSLAFYGSENNRELALRIRNTNISELPLGLFDYLGVIPQLSVDLSNNRLTSLRPAILYPNTTSWDRMGTKLIAGGLLLNNNPLQCQCDLTWIGGWLRRWLRESLEVGNAPANVARALHDAVRVATCTEPSSGKEIPLLQLRSEDTDCFASALASRSSITATDTILIIINAFLLITTIFYTMGDLNPR